MKTIYTILFNCFALSFAFSQNDNSNIKNRVLTLEKQISSISNDNKALRMANDSLSKINRNYVNKQDLYVELFERTYSHVDNIFALLFTLIGIVAPVAGYFTVKKIRRKIKRDNKQFKVQIEEEVLLLKKSYQKSNYNILLTNTRLNFATNNLEADLASQDHLLSAIDAMWAGLDTTKDLYYASRHELIVNEEITNVTNSLVAQTVSLFANSIQLTEGLEVEVMHATDWYVNVEKLLAFVRMEESEISQPALVAYNFIRGI